MFGNLFVALSQVWGSLWPTLLNWEVGQLPFLSYMALSLDTRPWWKNLFWLKAPNCLTQCPNIFTTKDLIPHSLTEDCQPTNSLKYWMRSLSLQFWVPTNQHQDRIPTSVHTVLTAAWQQPEQHDSSMTNSLVDELLFSLFSQHMGAAWDCHD